MKKVVKKQGTQGDTHFRSFADYGIKALSQFKLPNYPKGHALHGIDFGSWSLGNAVTMNPKEKNTVTVIKGEQTGHHHCFRDPEAVEVNEIRPNKNVELYDRAALKMFMVKVKKETEYEHYNVHKGHLTGEHRTLKLAPGNYLFANQININHDKTISAVQD